MSFILLKPATEALTMHYQEGHEKPRPLRVEAGLSLANVDFSAIAWETELPNELKDLVDGS